MKADTSEVTRILSRFAGANLTQTLGHIENAVRGVTRKNCDALLGEIGAGREVLSAAAEMKRIAGQINVTIHALGILLCLPRILEPGERVDYVSLGAGNTGRNFDLETNRRVAEFKFIRWRGGAESIRQNSVFKDYFQLAEHATEKRKYLYLLGREHALKFLQGGRALRSVLSRDDKLQQTFFKRFGSEFHTVREYFAAHGAAVHIQDVSSWLPELIDELLPEPEPAASFE